MIDFSSLWQHKIFIHCKVSLMQFYCCTREYLILFSRISISCKINKTTTKTDTQKSTCINMYYRITQLRSRWTDQRACCCPYTVICAQSPRNLSSDIAVSKSCSNNFRLWIALSFPSIYLAINISILTWILFPFTWGLMCTFWCGGRAQGVFTPRREQQRHRVMNSPHFPVPVPLFGMRKSGVTSDRSFVWHLSGRTH